MPAEAPIPLDRRLVTICLIALALVFARHLPLLTAARAVGMSRLQSIRYIVLPQALRIAIPAWSNEASIVLKDSSLVYALGVTEILRRAQQLSATTQQPFLAYGAAAVIYFVLVFATNRGLDYLSARTKLPTHP